MTRPPLMTGRNVPHPHPRPKGEASDWRFRFAKAEEVLR